MQSRRLTHLSLLDEKRAVEDVFDGRGEAVPVEDEGEVVYRLLPALLVPGHNGREWLQVVKINLHNGH